MSTAPPGAGTAGQKQPRQVSNIKELFESLTAADPLTRLETLRAIQAQPDAAMAFGLYKNGAHQNLDVIDLLLAGAASSRTSTEWMSWLGALAAFRDDRVTNFFLAAIPQEEAPQLIFSMARYLANSDLRKVWSRLVPVLLQDENPTRARAVAPLLPSAPNLSAAAKLRIAMLCSGPAGQAPALDESNLELWLAELAGPFCQEAQIALRAQGERAWTTLARVFAALTEENQLWLLRWGIEESSGMVAGLIPGALQSKAAALRVEALRAMAILKENGIPEWIAALAMPLLEDPDAQIREAAVLAGPSGIQWRAFLSRETVPSVRRAIILQLARTANRNSIPDLIALLASDDWQVRALCAEGLANLGECVVERIKPLVHDEDQRVRVAAVRVLLDLRQDTWLRHEFGLVTT